MDVQLGYLVSVSGLINRYHKGIEAENNSNHPPLLFLRHLEVGLTCWQRPCAVPQILQVCHTRQTHPDVCLRIIFVPVRLVAYERLPLIVDLRMHAEHLVGRKYKNLVVGLGLLVQRVVIEFHVPDCRAVMSA
jgi:hypothetical protein